MTDDEYDEECSLACPVVFKSVSREETDRLLAESGYVDRPFYIPDVGWMQGGKIVSREEAMTIYDYIGEQFPGEEPFIRAQCN